MSREVDDDAGLAGLDPATLEQLRRGFALHMDRQGNFSFEGDPVTHPGVVRLFRNGLDVSEAGETTIGVDGKWVYLKLDDLPLRVVRVAAREDDVERPELILDDGRRLALDPATLWEEPDLGLRCTVPAQGSGRPIPARFGNSAAVDLARWMVWEHDDARPQLAIAGQRWVIPEHAPG